MTREYIISDERKAELDAEADEATPIAKLIEDLRAVDYLHHRGPNYEPLPVPPSAVRLRAAEALASSEEEIARLRKALEPFAKVLEHDIGDDEADADRFQPMRTPYNRAPLLTVGDFRTASRALSGERDNG